MFLWITGQIGLPSESRARYRFPLLGKASVKMLMKLDAIKGGKKRLAGVTVPVMKLNAILLALAFRTISPLD